MGHKEQFFMMVVRHWSKLPRETVDGLSLEMFKVSTLSNLM